MRSGISPQSLVAEGANVDRKMNLWFKYRVLRREKSQLTLGLDWNYDKTFIVTPLEFAQDIINGEDLDTAGLIFDIKNWTAHFTAQYARAFSPTFGLRVDGQVGLYEVPFTSNVSKATHRLGLMLEMDLRHKLKIPLGLTLGRTQGFPGDDPTAGLSGTLLGFWYTGKQAFVVGVETGYMTLPVYEHEEDVDAMFGVVTVRYYF